MSEWIDVNERLPDDCTDVLIFDTDEDVLVGYYNGNLNLWQSTFSGYLYENECRVTHWMPMPKLPETHGKEQ